MTLSTYRQIICVIFDDRYSGQIIGLYFDEYPMLDPKAPYYDLPLLPPQQELETAPVLKSLVAAATHLSSLSATAESLPNPAVLYENIILSEAKDSSAIENIITTRENLYLTDLSLDEQDPHVKEVHNYADAIKFGWHDERPLCTSLMEKLCTLIKDKPMEVRKLPGTVLSNGNETIYTPPDGEALLRDMLDNLFQWMNAEDELHPIVKAAIAHYQFESIHPFYDGNGRTGRMMVVLYLVENNLIHAPILFFSEVILKFKSKYYELLQSTRESNDFSEYLLWFINMVGMAALTSTNRALRIKVSMQKLKHQLRKEEANIYSQDLINSLFLEPYIFADTLVKHKIVGTKQTAHNHLKRLEALGVIELLPFKFKRKNVWINKILLDSINAPMQRLKV